jgi:hypothetical protein
MEIYTEIEALEELIRYIKDYVTLDNYLLNKVEEIEIKLLVSKTYKIIGEE